MNITRPRIPVRSLTLGVCLLLSLSVAVGQDFGGRSRRFGGGGPPRGSLVSELNNPETQTEIQLTGEQREQIEELSNSQRDNRERFGDLFQQMQSAQSDEERQKIGEAIRERMQEIQAEADNKLKEILKAEQFARLQQLRLHREGPQALARLDDIAKDLKVSDAQREQLQKLSEERMRARWDLGRNASDEERQKFDEEWSQKFLAVLTPEQRSQWTEKLGPPPAGEAPGSSGPPTSSTPAMSSDRPRPVYVQPIPEGAAPVASFQKDGEAKSPPETSTPDSERKPAGDSKKLSFNFRYAPWDDVLKLFADEAGLSLDLNALPPGTFNYYDQGSYTPTEALDVLNGYLLPKGYCLVRRDDFLVCISIDEPIPPSLIPHVLPSELEEHGQNELLTVIFPIEGVDVEQVANEVNEIKGPQGKVVGLASTNSILVTDIGSNLRRIRDLLSDVTARGGPDDITFKAYQVRFVPVSDAELIVRDLLGAGSTVSNVSQAREERERDFRRMDDSSRSAVVSRTNPEVRITSDLRTNQLMVTATLAQHQLVESALKTIDVDGEESQFSPASQKPFLKVYTVDASDAGEVTKTIDALIPGVVVNEDGRNDKIHIFATPEQHRQVEMLIAQMDGLGGTQQMDVIPLSTLDPVSVTSTLRSMFLKDGEAAPIIEPDLYGRQLMVRGSSSQLAEIRSLLQRLGEDGTGNAGASMETLRSVPLSGRDPAELIPIIRQMWEAQQSAPLRVITPPDRSQPPGVTPTGAGSDGRRPADPQPAGSEDDAPGSVQNTPSSRPGKVPSVQFAQLTNSPKAEPSTEGAAQAPATSPPADETQKSQGDEPTTDQPRVDQTQPQSADAESKSPRPEVQMTVMGDELIITSSDPEQLDQLQAMLERTMQVLPPRTTWTVFTLQAADATEAANMLKILIPGATVSTTPTTGTGILGGLSSSATSIGNNLMDMTGLGTMGATQQLHIVPDVRQNALFVAGPSAQVREVEEMLKVLDASNLGGESLRDQYSRLIPIQHADAQEVYSIVKEVYKNYIDPPRVQQNTNPLAMLAGRSRGGRDGDENATAPPAKLAVGLDSNTGNLIVWADDAVFREVESLVQSLDQAAEAARRTVRVVPLENTNSVVMQNALGSLMPRITVTTTGSRQTSNPTPSAPSPFSGSSSSSSDDRSSDEARDRMREFFEQRMRERMQGGGEGFDPRRFGGDRGSFFNRGGSDRDRGGDRDRGRGR